MSRLLRHYWLELSVTFAAWVLVGWKMGLAAMLTTIILSMLEITLSADNAVVNSRVLVRMSKLWRLIFLTVGIFIAVFLVRFALPIFMVAVMTPLSGSDVVNLALYDADKYGEYLHDISPSINTFGGIFLFLVALFFFMERERRYLWIRPIETFLQRIGRWSSAKYVVAALVFVPILAIVDSENYSEVLYALIAGAGTYLVLHGITFLMEKVNDKNKLKEQVGWTAFVSFMYLEVLDASFSLDGVVGAFALTNNIIIIMVGLGIGALWVRTMTLYMVKHQTLTEYRYLESGAHWAIVCLAMIMFLKLAHIELPELLIGTVGLSFIGASVLSSIRANKKS
jgi:hypothetical protein